MRETTLLAIVAAAALLGMGLGYVLMPKRPAPIAQATVLVTPDVPAQTLTKVNPDAGKDIPEAGQPDPASTPEAIHAWRRQDKDAIKQRISALSNADAEQLCFTLQLIPRDEVFDKINVKGRLNRHIDDMRMDAEFGDIDTAFRDLRRDR
ncbi:hypothetical protein CfE428DRAFT_2121 [Chthoniobacter flavus Ellin428]|uniref:Uncharacterized protein n=1 Tax=Chthoniobacter flavus Ellin428 TaxID=497964 RepID=B4CZN3_9BACT|nr:hypothetical protein [Chthoniobacter flavus]EDY20197.1 hypothetical protein CfE428DRAFT_2121 [Chthoniobacter flavus Ellin428]TCO94094.1 hypothetical protein EV701_103181 [Chthoniobacter flavus]